MTDISPISNIPVVANNTVSVGSSNLGKNDFLNLLVTQLRYQDPLEPMQDSDFVAQLAQFSSLEQLSNISTTLGYSTELDYILSQTIANTMATTIIGKEVVADGNAIYHEYGADSRICFELEADAKNVEVKIYNETGSLVRVLSDQDLEKGMNHLDWDGKDNSGSSVAGGEYTFEITAKDSSDESVGVQTRIVGIVESVRYENGKGYLIINGQKIEMSDIIEVNLPDGSDNGSGNSEEEDPFWN
ncbi:MAG: flagellar hook capping protein [Candidatus Zixiibacteriota bacterium]|nr:MAG: flagellar hook capping protein [candidate division Zixibacteria bacterium]